MPGASSCKKHLRSNLSRVIVIVMFGSGANLSLCEGTSGLTGSLKPRKLNSESSQLRCVCVVCSHLRRPARNDLFLIVNSAPLLGDRFGFGGITGVRDLPTFSRRYQRSPGRMRRSLCGSAFALAVVTGLDFCTLHCEGSRNLRYRSFQMQTCSLLHKTTL